MPDPLQARGVALPAEIVRLEAALDAALVDRRGVERFEPGWIEQGRAWSDAVWAAAMEAEPLRLSDEAKRDGWRVAARPVFVCGAHRSGTTLMRDLLDGHPALAVLPAEAGYFGNAERRLARLRPDAAATEWGQEWLRRLANPANQPPFWLLGSGTARYLEFARCLLAWLAAPDPDKLRSWPLAAVALAYAQTTRGIDDDLLGWVEKTPGTERHLDLIWSELPEARILHVVRAPDEVAASYRALVRHANADAPSLARFLRGLSTSSNVCGRRTRLIRKRVSRG